MNSPVSDKVPAAYALENADELYHPGFSVDCVPIGFHDKKLKVLLVNRGGAFDKWEFPGGRMLKNETAEQAGKRYLYAMAGLDKAFLRQVHLFSDLVITGAGRNRDAPEQQRVAGMDSHFSMQRFVGLGFYALIRFGECTPLSPENSECRVQWFELERLPELAGNHQRILNKVLECLRWQLNYEPIGYNLLPDEFTIPELQKLYEAILGVNLERSNFKRKIMALDILINTYGRRMGGKHKAPFLYRFNIEKYQEAVQKGFDRV